MKRIANLLLIFLAVVACVVGLYVSAANRDIVIIDLLFWPAVPVRSGLLVVLAFVTGAVAGLGVSGLTSAARMRREQWRALRNGRGG